MKHLFIIVLIMVLSFRAKSQNNPSVGVINQYTLHNQFSDYVQFSRQENIRRHRGRFFMNRSRFFPSIRPKKIKERKNVIILIFDKKEFQHYQLNQRDLNLKYRR